MKKLLSRFGSPILFVSLGFVALACSEDDEKPSPGGGSGTVEGLLIDDFEDGDTSAKVPGGWYGYTDVMEGGSSTLTFTGGSGSQVAVNGAGFKSQKSLEASFRFDQGRLTYAPFIGMGVSLGTPSATFDASGYPGISYTYRGSAHRLQLQTSEVSDYGYYGATLPASSTWKTVVLPFDSLTQEDWAVPVAFDPAHVLAVDYQARGATGQTGTLALDDLFFTELQRGEPDMQVRPPSPPSDATIDSIAIDNPLQAKAERYLSRGYNITNWLEQERFSGFSYDENFVKKVADAGFKGIRLPIDFDLYVASTAGSGDALTVEVDPDLFEVIDAFDRWTEAHGLSLTIDYHQYGTLPDKAKPDSIATAVALWGKVAEHLAPSPREDIFLELFNEPELSFAGVDPTQAEWTAIAERMVAAIREKDSVHSIIFGDVEWYGIAPLSRRAPLSDANVIYSFHIYDPFIFTHQGATWANMGSTHGLPYPYDPARWSGYYSDLGFNTAMEGWVLSDAQSYYRNGNRSTLRNKILQAKRWAVSHDVPVICNEFGAYDRVSLLADRARYYTDIVSIFDELSIPWQHWFMVMDASGAVVPEYRSAMRLDP